MGDWPVRNLWLKSWRHKFSGTRRPRKTRTWMRWPPRALRPRRHPQFLPPWWGTKGHQGTPLRKTDSDRFWGTGPEKEVGGVRAKIVTALHAPGVGFPPGGGGQNDRFSGIRPASRGWGSVKRGSGRFLRRMLGKQTFPGRGGYRLQRAPKPGRRSSSLMRMLKSRRHLQKHWWYCDHSPWRGRILSVFRMPPRSLPYSVFGRLLCMLATKPTSSVNRGPW